MTHGPGPYDPQPRPTTPGPDPVQPGHAPTEAPVRQPNEIPATDPDRSPPGPANDPNPTPWHPGPRARSHVPSARHVDVIPGRSGAAGG
jgi:hypothetical protein